MATTLIETPAFAVIALRVGLVMRRNRDAREVYIQPGEGEATMRANVEDWHDLPDRIRADIVNSEIAEYFAA